MTPSVSVAMILKNAGQSVRRALDSIGGLYDEIIVILDSSTQDDTEAIVREEYGAKVTLKDWTGFADARNWSLRQARCDWLLIIDGDEELVDRGDLEELLPIADAAGVKTVLWTVRTVHESSGAIRTTDRGCPRMFKRSMGVRYRFAIHNQPVGIDTRAGKVTHSSAVLNAYYPDSYEERWERNEGRLLAYRAQHKRGSDEWRHATLYLARGATAVRDMPSAIRYAREGIEENPKACHSSMWPLYSQALLYVGGQDALDRVKEVLDECLGGCSKCDGEGFQPKNVDALHQMAAWWLRRWAEAESDPIRRFMESNTGKWVQHLPDAGQRLGMGFRKREGS